MLSQLINTAERSTIPLERIKTDGGTQMRATLDADTVQEYLDAMQPIGWGDFPAVIVYYDGTHYWLADGFHRVEAYRRAAANLDQPANVPADVRSGTRRDAILHAAGANASHGLRRTNADKRRAVETLLRDDDWRHWSNREIGRRCAVDEGTVRKIRAELERTAEIPQSDERHGADGRVTNTANIGATRTLSSDTPAAQLPGKPLSDEQVAEFLAAHWTKSALQRIADAPSPPAAVRAEMNGNLGFANPTCRGEYSKGKMRAWHIDNGPLFGREPDETWTAFEYVTLTLQLLPPRPSAISNQQSPISNPAPATLETIEPRTIGRMADIYVRHLLKQMGTDAALDHVTSIGAVREIERLLNVQSSIARLVATHASDLLTNIMNIAVTDNANAATVQIIEYNADAPLPEWAEEPAQRVIGYSVLDDIALREQADEPAKPSHDVRRLTADEMCTALLGQAIVDAYTVAGVIRLTLDNNQLVTISSPSGGLMYAIEEA